MKNLVVGQKIYMRSGNLLKEVTVGEITGSYVRVEIAPNPPAGARGDAIDLSYEGTQLCSWGGIDGWDPRPVGTEFGQWQLVDPSANHKTVFVGNGKRNTTKCVDMSAYAIGQKVWMRAGDELQEGTVVSLYGGRILV